MRQSWAGPGFCHQLQHRHSALNNVYILIDLLLLLPYFAAAAAATWCSYLVCDMQATPDMCPGVTKTFYASQWRVLCASGYFHRRVAAVFAPTTPGNIGASWGNPLLELYGSVSAPVLPASGATLEAVYEASANSSQLGPVLNRLMRRKTDLGVLSLTNWVKDLMSLASSAPLSVENTKMVILGVKVLKAQGVEVQFPGQKTASFNDTVMSAGAGVTGPRRLFKRSVLHSLD